MHEYSGFFKGLAHYIFASTTNSNHEVFEYCFIGFQRHIYLKAKRNPHAPSERL